MDPEWIWVSLHICAGRVIYQRVLEAKGTERYMSALVLIGRIRTKRKCSSGCVEREPNRLMQQ